jgi:hypothetical protein
MAVGETKGTSAVNRQQRVRGRRVDDGHVSRVPLACLRSVPPQPELGRLGGCDSRTASSYQRCLYLANNYARIRHIAFVLLSYNSYRNIRPQT